MGVAPKNTPTRRTFLAALAGAALASAGWWAHVEGFDLHAGVELHAGEASVGSTSPAPVEHGHVHRAAPARISPSSADRSGAARGGRRLSGARAGSDVAPRRRRVSWGTRRRGPRPPFRRVERLQCQACPAGGSRGSAYQSGGTFTPAPWWADARSWRWAPSRCSKGQRSPSLRLPRGTGAGGPLMPRLASAGSCRRAPLRSLRWRWCWRSAALSPFGVEVDHGHLGHGVGERPRHVRDRARAAP